MRGFLIIFNIFVVSMALHAYEPPKYTLSQLPQDEKSQEQYCKKNAENDLSDIKSEFYRNRKKCNGRIGQSLCEDENKTKFHTKCLKQVKDKVKYLKEEIDARELERKGRKKEKK